MLRNRPFLMGLGTGMIIGALLLQLMFQGQQNQKKLENMADNNDQKLYTQIEVDALISAAKDSDSINKELKSGSVEGNNQSSSVDNKASTEATEPVKGDQAADVTIKEEKVPAITAERIEHIIKIDAGSGLTKTAELIAGQNIIKNEAEFIKQMKKSKKLVRAGYFLFNEGLTTNEAIKVVTSEPIPVKQAKAILSKEEKK